MRKLQDYYRQPPSLHGNDSEKKREEILDYFITTYELFEKLFEPLASVNTYYKAPDEQRHPILFYFGHTATFFINKLIIAKELEERINPMFESMFAIGVDEMSWDDMDSSHYEWPSVQATQNYRDEVKALVIDLIKSKPLVLPITWNDTFWWTILMGIEHERIHLETSSVLHRQLDLSDVTKSTFWRRSEDGSPEFPQNSLVPIKAQMIRMGRKDDSDYYGWDNEYGKQEEEVDAFNA
ncbi:MAG: DinB family protein, partial [Thiovulaceae bacterium]|nr:DinB family protein [Sulfurimonadaceae bacterium]